MKKSKKHTILTKHCPVITTRTVQYESRTINPGKFFGEPIPVGTRGHVLGDVNGQCVKVRFMTGAERIVEVDDLAIWQRRQAKVGA